MKRHLKRLAIPKSWKVKRRGLTFILRPNPGPHPFKLGMPINSILRDVLKLAKNSKEAKQILYGSEVLVDGIRRKELKFPVGIMDVINFTKSGKTFRVVLDKGKLEVMPIDKKEAEIKPCRITGKTKVKGKSLIALKP